MCRILNADNVLLRPSVSTAIGELASSHYAVFQRLATCNEILESHESPRAYEDISSFYNQLYSIGEMVKRFHRATKEVLEQYGSAAPSELRRRLGDELYGEYDRTQEDIQFYRAIHSPSPIRINEKIPRRDIPGAEKYHNLGYLSKVLSSPERDRILREEFVNAIDQCRSDLQRMEEVLNSIWQEVLKELDSMPDVNRYRNNQDKITDEDRRFCNPQLFPPTFNSLTGTALSGSAGVPYTGGSITYHDVKSEERGND